MFCPLSSNNALREDAHFRSFSSEPRMAPIRQRLAQVVPQNFAHLVEFLAVRIPQALNACNPTWHKSVASRIERGSGTQGTCSPRVGR